MEENIIKYGSLCCIRILHFAHFCASLSGGAGVPPASSVDGVPSVAAVAAAADAVAPAAAAASAVLSPGAAAEIASNDEFLSSFFFLIV